ncbi:hypothetical protein HFO68_30925 [Rhizobium laguerreae]|nr:hypothetical protein [Rhizobium laguerreae]
MLIVALRFDSFPSGFLSIVYAMPRRHRRAKTDRIDGETLAFRVKYRGELWTYSSNAQKRCRTRRRFRRLLDDQRISLC